MIIEEISTYYNFKYLWLKTVESVNMSVHCARCLIGEYDRRINSHLDHKENIVLDKGKIYYLCGVTKPFIWERNFHLAFKYEKGGYIDIEENGIRIKIKDAIMLPITQEYIDKDIPHANERPFYSCRNWQFANWFLKNMKYEV